MAPLLSIIPPPVAIVFISDMRFKMETFNALRHAFRIVGKLSEVVTKNLLAAKIHERAGDDLVAFHLDALEALNLSDVITDE